MNLKVGITQFFSNSVLIIFTKSYGVREEGMLSFGKAKEVLIMSR